MQHRPLLSSCSIHQRRRVTCIAYRKSSRRGKKRRKRCRRITSLFSKLCQLLIRPFYNLVVPNRVDFLNQITPQRLRNVMEQFSGSADISQHDPSNAARCTSRNVVNFATAFQVILGELALDFHFQSWHDIRALERLSAAKDFHTLLFRLFNDSHEATFTASMNTTDTQNYSSQANSAIAKTGNLPCTGMLLALGLCYALPRIVPSCSHERNPK